MPWTIQVLIEMVQLLKSLVTEVAFKGLPVPCQLSSDVRGDRSTKSGVFDKPCWVGDNVVSIVNDRDRVDLVAIETRDA